MDGWMRWKMLARTAQLSGVRRCNECACFALLTTSNFNTTGQTHRTRNLPQTQALGLACMRYSACVRVTWCDRRVGFQHPPRDTATGKRESCLQGEMTSALTMRSAAHLSLELVAKAVGRLKPTRIARALSARTPPLLEVHQTLAMRHERRKRKRLGE